MSECNKCEKFRQMISFKIKNVQPQKKNFKQITELIIMSEYLEDGELKTEAVKLSKEERKKNIRKVENAGSRREAHEQFNLIPLRAWLHFVFIRWALLFTWSSFDC